MSETPIRIECDDITQFQPGDQLLLRYKERRLTIEEAQEIKEMVTATFGDSIKVLIVDANFEPFILRNDNAN